MFRRGWARPRRSEAIAGAILHPPTDQTSLDPETGAVTSRQSADIDLDSAQLDALWTPEHLERAARTYWSSMQRFSLGLMRVHYSARERAVILLIPQLRLLRFHAPEYELAPDRGVVRWRIERGPLVSSRGRGGDGYLELDFQRFDREGEDRVRLRVEVEVANYYPTLTRPWSWVYTHTQSRIHVIACNYFLRRLVRRDLDTSRIGSHAVPR
jgi:hypothetical protein